MYPRLWYYANGNSIKRLPVTPYKVINSVPFVTIAVPFPSIDSTAERGVPPRDVR